jgi:hypothetical protein
MVKQTKKATWTTSLKIFPLTGECTEEAQMLPWSSPQVNTLTNSSGQTSSLTNQKGLTKSGPRAQRISSLAMSTLLSLPLARNKLMCKQTNSSQSWQTKPQSMRLVVSQTSLFPILLPSGKWPSNAASQWKPSRRITNCSYLPTNVILSFLSFVGKPLSWLNKKSWRRTS